MSDMAPFDRAAVRRRRDRAAPGFAAHDFLFRAVAERLVDRLDDVTHRFPVALEVGCRTGLIGPDVIGRGGVTTWIGCELSPAMATLAPAPVLVGDEERLPIADGAVDLILAPLSLHWVNDLPGALVQMRRALRPDGLLLAALFGGATLSELREALLAAEATETGGAHPRVSPMTDLRDLGGLLQRAGFALPVIDAEMLTVSYPDALALMRDLRGMGETNATVARCRHPTRRAVLARAAAEYAQRAAEPDGRVTARFEVLYATGWAPHPRQQRPLRPGSAQARLADALATPEIKL
jgi:SAM-dependent methyltransferase